MMKYFFTTTGLIFLLSWPIHAQEFIPQNELHVSEVSPALPVHLATVSETNYLNQLALRGFNLETQGLLIESLDARTVYAELNSNVGFNPARSAAARAWRTTTAFGLSRKG